MTDKTILIVGTYDTKNDELEYMADRITAQGGGVLTMDISVLGDPEKPTDISKHQVAEAGGQTIQALIDQGEESVAMAAMADGASVLASQMRAEGKFDGVVILGVVSKRIFFVGRFVSALPAQSGENVLDFASQPKVNIRMNIFEVSFCRFS